jgi:hypothetical protein
MHIKHQNWVFLGKNVGKIGFIRFKGIILKNMNNRNIKMGSN